MPVIYYTYYTSGSRSPKETTALEHRLGRQLLNTGLAALYGITLSPDELSFGERGKPFLSSRPDIHFNISHCRELVLCAFDSDPVGVDAEIPGYFSDALIARTLSDSEKTFLDKKTASEESRREWFYRFWTLKEAYVKRSGIGVDTSLTAFSFSFREPEEAGGCHVSCSDPSVLCFQKKLPTGHIVSLCFSGRDKNVLLRPVLLPGQ